jgi:hypothetical protein
MSRKSDQILIVKYFPGKKNVKRSKNLTSTPQDKYDVKKLSINLM